MGPPSNKVVILHPPALVLSAFAPGSSRPSSYLGGTSLCFQGAEKVWHLFAHRGGHDEKGEPTARGVVESTAVLPEGWEGRLVRFEIPATNGVVAWCLEVHDLRISKAIAGRPKDLEFCEALARRGIVDGKTLEARLVLVRNSSPRVRYAVEGRITSL
ncbi:MAG: hypothetical protein AMXMBFR53_27790 [Gemmatimonadota bacterium]